MTKVGKEDSLHSRACLTVSKDLMSAGCKLYVGDVMMPCDVYVFEWEGRREERYCGC
jgi:hypothetical protein